MKIFHINKILISRMYPIFYEINKYKIEILLLSIITKRFALNKRFLQGKRTHTLGPNRGESNFNTFLNGHLPP